MANWLGIGTGGNIASSIVSPIVEGINYRKRSREAMERQVRLMGIQQQNQMDLNQQGANLSYQNWLRTNYSAQIEQMRNAGLSPGLIYGKGGGQGGTTAGAGGSAQGGNAPTGNFSGQPFEIGSKLMDMAMMQSQKKNIDADTEVKAEERLNKREERLLTRQQKLLAIEQTGLTKWQKQKIQEEIAKVTADIDEVRAKIRNIDADTAVKDQEKETEVERTGKTKAEKEIAEIEAKWMKETGTTRQDAAWIRATIQSLQNQGMSIDAIKQFFSEGWEGMKKAFNR